MPKKKSKPEEKHTNEVLFGYILRNDARILALEMTISEILRLKPKQQAVLNKMQETNYKLILQQMIEQVETSNPALAARLLDGQDIYSNLV